MLKKCIKESNNYNKFRPSNCYIFHQNCMLNPLTIEGDLRIVYNNILFYRFRGKLENLKGGDVT